MERAWSALRILVTFRKVAYAELTNNVGIAALDFRFAA